MARLGVLARRTLRRQKRAGEQDESWAGRHLSIDHHEKFTSFPDADFIVPVGGCVPPPGGVCSASAAGNRLPFAPRTTFNLGGSYRIAVGSGALSLAATYYRTSRFFAAPDNIGFQPSYDLVNASVTWTGAGDHLSVKLWGKSLGGAAYATSLVEANQGLVLARGAPRTYGATLGYRF